MNGCCASSKWYMKSDLICCPLLADGEVRFYSSYFSLNPPAHYDCSLHSHFHQLSPSQDAGGSGELCRNLIIGKYIL